MPEENLPTQRVSHTESHSMHILTRNGVQQVTHLSTDTTHQLAHSRVINTLDLQIVLNQSSKLRVSHSQRILQTSLLDRLLKELLESIIQRTINQSRSSGKSLRGVLELLEVNKLQTIIL